MPTFELEYRTTLYLRAHVVAEDQEQAETRAGDLVGEYLDSLYSPRLSVSVDPVEDGPVAVEELRLA